MSEEEKKESGIVYEQAIDISIDNEEDDDEDDEVEDEVDDEEHGEDGSPGSSQGDDSNTNSIADAVNSTVNNNSNEHNVEKEENEGTEEPANKKIKLGQASNDSNTSLTTVPTIDEKNKEEDGANKNDSNKGKKVPLHLLEKRRIGRIKAAEEFAKRLKKIGIEKVESTTLPHSGGFRPLTVINQKNYSSDYIRKDEQIFALRERKSLRSAGNTNTNTNTNQVPASPSVSETPDDVGKLAEPMNDNKDNVSIVASEFTAKNDEIDFSDAASTIIIQPGSESIKIGFALDDTPLVIPNCVAIPLTKYKDTTKRFIPKNRLQEEQPDEFYTLKDHLQSTFKQRMRYYKRRIQANSYDQVTGFNAVTRGEPIPDQYDGGRVSWIENPQDDTIYIGEKALRCTAKKFIHRRPFCCSTGGAIFNLNDANYSSIEEVYSDAIRILKYGIRKLIKRRQDRKQSNANLDLFTSEQTRAVMEDIDENSIFKAILIIPDIFEKTHVEYMIRLMLTELSFNAVALMQESLAACYGSGTGVSTCVVNVGAAKTRIACVDDGSIVENSCVTLDYGGDDISRLFAKLLLLSNFPYANWDTNTVSGWKNAELLKKQCITFQDIDVTTQLFNFIKRVPGERTEKIEFKTFDEVMVAPLALFEPKIFSFLKQNRKNVAINKILRQQLPVSRDLFTNVPNDWESLTEDNCRDNKLYSDFQDNLDLINNILDNILENRQVDDSSIDNQRLNMTPLDKAIIQSITNAALDVDISKLTTFYSNILIIGGSSKIPAFDFMLTDRINIWRPRLLSLNSFPTFYKKLLGKIKDLEVNAKNSSNSVNVTTTNTAVSTPNSGTTTTKTENNDDEDDGDELHTEMNEDNKVGTVNLREQIDSMVRQELEQYIKETESHSSSEHFLPVSVVPAPHDRDPSLILWKGATVLAQIKLIEELYITETDWDVHGSRILQHKCLFAY